ncbi:MAG: T4SS-associated protein EirA [Legionellales bacterium]|nr:T4SS-associated protein EirA [Legionellales bacterium]
MPRYLIFLVIFIALAVNAQTTTPAASTLSEKAGFSTCPPIASLQVDNLRWSAPGGWVSYYQSFVQEVAHFNGAHWIGVKIGKVLCTYTGASQYAFPLTLENAAFIYKPIGNKWGQEVNGVVNCLSNNINDCPFYIVKKSNTLPNENELLNLKK